MQTETDVERIRSIISTVLEVPLDKVQGATHFIHDLGSDSLRVIEIVARIESELEIAIDQSEVARMVSLDAILDVLGTSKVEG